MKKTREQKRGEYKKKRRKKFNYLRNTGQLENYYKKPEEDNKSQSSVEVEEIKKETKMPQAKNKFDKDSLIKIFKGAGIAGGAVIALYVLQGLVKLDFGQYTPAIVGVLSILINAIKEYRKGE